MTRDPDQPHAEHDGDDPEKDRPWLGVDDTRHQLEATEQRGRHGDSPNEGRELSCPVIATRSDGRLVRQSVGSCADAGDLHAGTVKDGRAPRDPSVVMRRHDHQPGG